MSTRLLLQAFIIATVGLGGLFLMGQTAGAISDTYPNPNNPEAAFIPAADADNAYLEVSQSGGGNTLQANITTVNAYFTTPGLKTITILSGRSCGAPDFQVVPDGSLTTRFTVWSAGGGSVTIGNAGSCANPNLTVTRNAVETITIGNQTLYVIHVRADVENAIGPVVNAFKVSASSPTGQVYVTIPQTTGGSLENSYFALQRRPGQGSGTRNFTLYFGSDCTITSNTTKTLYWYDDDWNTLQSGTQFGLQLAKRPKGSAAWTPIGFSADGANQDSPSRALGGGNSLGPAAIYGPLGLNSWFPIRTTNDGARDTGWAQFTAEVDYEYRLIITEVNGTNGIRFALPFDSIYQGFRCEADLCTNIPGNQSAVPPGMVKNTPGNVPGICTTPPISTTGCEFNQPANGLVIRVGESLPVSVRAYNGTAARWTGHTRPLGAGVTELPNTPDNSPAQWNTHLTMNNPSPYVGYVQKYDPHAGHGGTQGTLNPNTFSNWTAFAVDTATPGLKTYTFYLVRKIPSTGSYVHLAPHNVSAAPHCTFTFTVFAEATGTIFGANCSNISGTINYQGAGGVPTGLLRIIRLRDGVQPAADVMIGAADSFGPSNFFNKRPFVDWRLAPHETYRVELHMQNSLGQWQPNPVASLVNNGNPCLRITACSAGINALSSEPGETIDAATLGPLRVRVANDTNNARFDPSYGYATSVVMSGGLVAVPSFTSPVAANIPPGEHDVGVNVGLIANSTGVITVDFMYQGTSFNALGLSNIVPCSQTIEPATRPYLKVYGGDILAGGEFNGQASNCYGGFTATGGIRTFARVFGAPNDDRGASAEYGVLSIGIIDGSSSNRNGLYSSDTHAGRIGDYSTYANTVPNYWGGNLGGEHCIANYWYQTSGGVEPTPAASGSTAITGPAFDISNAADDTRYYFNGGPGYNGTLRITGGTIPSGKQLTIYADGNIFITGNIIYNYAPGFSYAQPDTIPYLTIIARGNIYVADQVTRIDGLYVAQPQTQPGGQANRGRFISCVIDAAGPNIPSSTEGPNSFIDRCRQKLLINGAVVAQRIKPWRLGDSTTTLWRAPANETAQLYGLPETLAREEVQFIPDILLGIPAYNYGQAMPTQAIFGAPPIF